MADKNVILKEAQKYLARGQIDKAVIEWEKLAKEAPDGNTFNTIGDLYLKKGNKKSAIEFFHKAAGFFREGGFSLKALALYKKIINIDPSDAGAFIALGELSEEKGLATDAIKYYLTSADILSREPNKEKFANIYERILSLSPSNIPLREKVAGLFLKEGLTSQAVREYLHAAELLLEKDDMEHALAHLTKVLEIQPGNGGALAGLSAIYEKKGDLRQAAEYMKQAVASNPGDPGSLMRCAYLHKELGEYDEAVGWISKILETSPSDFDANRMMGDIRLIKGEREKAWDSYKEIVDSLIAEDKIIDAIELVKQFKDIDPVDTGKLLLSLYRRRGDTDGIVEEMISLADILSGGGFDDEAADYYREALKLRPDDIRLKKILAEKDMAAEPEASAEVEERSAEDLIADADIFIKYGLFDDAQRILEELKLRDPGNPDVHIKLKSVYLDTNSKEEAVTECLILSEIYRRSGDITLYRDALREASEISPEDPRVIEKLAVGHEEAPAPAESERITAPALDDYGDDIAQAEFYMTQGLKEEALRVYHKLVKIFPENEDFRNAVSYLGGDLAESVAGGAEAAGYAEDAAVTESPPVEEEIVEAGELQGIPEQQFDTDVLDIFEEFKKGIEKELEEEDSETHYNLGIAYKEMGLIDDAILEFQTSKKNPDFSTSSVTMLGICYMEKGLFPLAIKAFGEAVADIKTRDESYWGVRYDLASAYEKNGDNKEAFDIFSEIYGWNSKFREVAERLDRLGGMLPKEETAVKPKEKRNRVSYI